MGIYLCHMVIFRGLEKIGCLHLLSNDIMSYIFALILVIIGAIVFSYILQRVLKHVSIYINKKRSKGDT